MEQVKVAVVWSPAPDDPYEDIMPEGVQVPPEGASEGDDPMYIDTYTGEQFIHSVSQFYDNAWPIDAAPVAA